jgi:hypothetical protein
MNATLYCSPDMTTEHLKTSISALCEFPKNAPAHVLSKGDYKGIPSIAIFSPCDAIKDAKYRYALARIWNETLPVWTFVMLNPSDATHCRTDSTVTIQVERARRGGAGGIIVVNCGAIRQKYSDLAVVDADPIGPDNAFWVAHYLKLAGKVVLAFGDQAARFGGEKLIKELIGNRPCFALGVTQRGWPRHPRGVGYDTPLIEYQFTN